jgi:hypothetical protein
MRTRKYYCSACDREIQVLVGDDGAPLDAPGGAPVCLDHGARCTGELCPLFDVPSAEMKAAADHFRDGPPPASASN